jgi:nitroreductase
MYLVKMEPYFKRRHWDINGVRAFWDGIFSAPVHIFVLCDDRGLRNAKRHRAIMRVFNLESVSAACQNILLSAEALGLGGLWISSLLTMEDEVKAILKVPGGLRLTCAIAIGFPAEKSKPKPRKPLSEVMFLEKMRR